MSQYVTFRLKNQLMGMEILLVREINQLKESTFVHLAPQYVAGLINLRGQIVTIFDLAVRLGMTPCTIGEETHNIILKTNDELSRIRVKEERADLASSDDMVGLRVDSIGDVVEFTDEQVESIPANIHHIDERFLAGVVPFKEELMFLLNAGMLLNSEVQ